MATQAELKTENAQWTPGPWSVTLCHTGEKCWCRTISIAGREESDALEDCVIPSGAVSKRDAHLIAAAPELYEALETLVSFAGAKTVSSLAWHQARRALAKARGHE